MNPKEDKLVKIKEKTTIPKVVDFLKRTGFILEMEVAEILKNKDFKVTVNDYFFDYDENKKREMDIVALKQINEIKLVFIIECKQSLFDDWVFVCSDKEPSRYYNYIKHLPNIYKIKEAGLFNHLHTLDKKVPLAQNFTVRHASGKKSESQDIYECVKKLPKIVVDKTYSSYGNKKDRVIIFPLAVFSGQIFIAEYSNDLVREVDTVQYATELDSNAYTYHYKDMMFDMHKSQDREENTPIAETSRRLGSLYLIDFVTKRGLVHFLDKVEKQLEKINLELWPIEKS